MSLWSAIGLADRKTVDKLLLELQNLRNETQILMAENQKLLIEKINRECEDIFQAEAKNTDDVKSLVSETFQNLSKQINCTSEQNAHQISEAGTSVIKAVVDTGEQMNSQFAEVRNNVEEAIENQNKIKKESELRATDVISEIGRTKAELEGVLHDMETELCEIGFLEKSHRERISQIEEIFLSAFEEIKLISKKYQNMKSDEKENLDRIKELSNQFIELGNRQQTVMERLSQLCQDSEQFMEIQKSINDIWEIMKVVWVDSLLNEYKKEIE